MLTVDSRELMARAQAGDIDAFGELYARYRGEVYRYAASRLPHLAEDITQDVFVRALGALGQWRDQGKDVGAWLCTITMNLCRDAARKAENRLTSPAGEFPDWAFPPGPDPGVLVVEDLARREVLTALLALTDSQRRALVLRYLVDLSLAQVAWEMGSTVGAAKVLLVRARRAFARALTEYARYVGEVSDA